MSQPHVALLLSDLNPGGVQHTFLRVAHGLLARGVRVSLLACHAGGKLEAAVPAGARLVDLDRHGIAGRLRALLAAPSLAPALVSPLLLARGRSKSTPAFPALVDWLKLNRPDTLMSATPFLNIEAWLARRASGVRPRLVLSENSHFSVGKPRKRWKVRRLARTMHRAYAEADGLVANSNGTADDIAQSIGLDRDRFTVIHNPTYTPDLHVRASEPCDHPWLQGDGPPVLLGVGRPTKQKDFPTLLRAFARVRALRPVRLVLIGEVGKPDKRGVRRAALADLAAELGVAADVDLLGYRANPLPYMARASVFGLSSTFEGFGNVLIEALACGTPVVSTDCPSGPAEILDHGRFGRMVPVGDDAAFAEAVLATLDDPLDPETLKRRAQRFDFAASIAAYASILLPDATTPAKERDGVPQSLSDAL